MKNILKSLFALAASSIFTASCQKELAGYPRQPATQDTVSLPTPPTPPSPVPPALPAPMPTSSSGDVANLMIRDGMSDAIPTWWGANYFLEPLKVETNSNSVPQANWLNMNYSLLGNFTVKVSAPLNAIPKEETFNNDLYTTKYENPAHTNAAGYNNNVLPVVTEITRNDGGIVAYGLKPNAAGGQDTVARAKKVSLYSAAKVTVTAPKLPNGTNPMHNATANQISNTASIFPNSRLGQNGVIYHFTQ